MQDRKINNLMIHNSLLWMVIGGLCISLIQLYATNLNRTAEINYLQAYSKHIETKGLEHWYTTQKAPEWKVAKVTAYSCGGINTEAEMLMNCPSLKNGSPKTANGTTPEPMKTMACDKANMGKVFDLQGIGKVLCSDTGGAIKGQGRFDLYVSNIDEAYEWGTQYMLYKEDK
jgi:3D (Asp-Asp-Asp) domain-containing protein